MSRLRAVTRKPAKQMGELLMFMIYIYNSGDVTYNVGGS